MRGIKVNRSFGKKGLRALLLGLVIGAIVIVLTFFIWSNFGKLFLKSPTEQANEQSFARLSYSINQVLAEEGFSFTRGTIMQLKSDYAIVGFNKDWPIDALVDNCGSPSEKILKPVQCQKSACLCLYKDTNVDFNNNGLVECRLFNDVEYFVSMDYLTNSDKYKDVIPKKEVIDNQVGTRLGLMNSYYPNIDEFNNDYSYFVLYGECNDNGPDEELGLRDYYVEKYVYDNKNIIFINYESSYNDARIVLKPS